jgi:metal-sulfur cluster biosynthetic enzyme
LGVGTDHDIDISDANDVTLTMTLTTPHCPAAETLPLDVEKKVAAVDGVASVKVDITWEPAWSPQMMSEAARLELNL